MEKLAPRRFLSALGVALLAAPLFAPPALADVIYTGGGNGIRQSVDVTGVEDGQLVYLLNGNRVTTPLANVGQIQIDGETAFNDAEKAYAAGDLAKAADAYQQVVRRRGDDWLKTRAAERLVKAADKAGLFPAAVTGYVQLTRLAPAAAVGNEPALGASIPPDQLDAAAREVDAALGTRLSPQQEKTLLAFQLGLQNRRGDAAGAARTLDRLGGLVGDQPGDDPRLFAQITLARAKAELANNKPAAAAKLVNDHRKVFTDPRQQSDALLVLADAARASAGSDQGKLLDAALAYMKVVTFFKTVPDAPNVPAALLATGEIHEKLGKTEAARSLYQEVVDKYAAAPAADAAQKHLAAMTKPAAK